MIYVVYKSKMNGLNGFRHWDKASGFFTLESDAQAWVDTLNRRHELPVAKYEVVESL